jgi:hypothetical protein
VEQTGLTVAVASNPAKAATSSGGPKVSSIRRVAGIEDSDLATVYDCGDAAEVIGEQVKPERILDVAHHLRLHRVKRLVRATGLIANLKVIRAIPDDCRKTSANVLDLLEAV